jgi:hypothetical protein
VAHGGRGRVATVALSLGEAAATMLLLPQRPPMLMPMLMTWVHMLRYDAMIEGTLLLVMICLGLGVLATVIFVSGRRYLRRGAAVLGFAVVCGAAGCGAGDQPDEVWGEVAEGPRPLIYPRAIARDPASGDFYVVDRAADPALDPSGRF